jgi:glyoxylase-like metal-dependent hydrolase (beta-lactamase superfamily II)
MANWHYEDDDIRIRKLCVGPYENNTYVVVCRKTGQAVIVDAANEPDRLVAAVADVEPVAILTTHGHFDHVAAVAAVRDALGIPFRLHAADVELAGIEPDDPLVEGPITVGDITIDVLHTPGHTPGSTCFVAGDAVLSGDTLFPGGPGATHFAGASFAQIIESIRDRLFSLPDETLVFPGHGLDTVIGVEAPSLDAWVERGW